MNQQEQQVLAQFLDQLTAVRGVVKDNEADGMIRAAVSRQPDSAYLLVQRALLLDQALSDANKRIAELESQTRNATTRSSFLDNSPWAQPARRETTNVYGEPIPPHAATPAMQAAPAVAANNTRGGAGSFLASAAATAAGVAGGAFLFQGLEHMFNRDSGMNNMMSSSNPWSGNQTVPENATVNNYHGDQVDPQDQTTLANDPFAGTAYDSNVDDGIDPTDGDIWT